MSDPRPLDRAATEICGIAVAAVEPDQLDLPTPCSEWSLGELIAHLVAENRGFTAADLLDRSVEVREFGVFPGSAAVAMHFVDNLAHAWDVARSIGLPDPIP